jgi:hypothetical protein
MDRLSPVQMRSFLILVLFLNAFLSWTALPVSAADSAAPPSAQPPLQPATPGEDPSEHHEITPSCRAEVKQLCRGILPGGGRIKKCIEANESKLSPACQKAVQERLEREGSQRQ